MPQDTVQEQLLLVQRGHHVEKRTLDELRKRKLLATQKLLHFSVNKGPHYSRSIAKIETDLTAELLQRLAAMKSVLHTPSLKYVRQWNLEICNFQEVQL